MISSTSTFCFVFRRSSLRIASATAGEDRTAASDFGEVALFAFQISSSWWRFSDSRVRWKSFRLLAGGLIADEVDLHREVDLDWKASAQVVGAPVRASADSSIQGP